MNLAFARALALFDEVVALAPMQRASRLAALAQEDPAVHDALRRLLVTDDTLDHDDAHALEGLQDALFRGDGAAEAAGADPYLGTRLGPWRIEARIDSGGMGTVYEAWRDDGQYRQRVALKCMRHELASPRLVESFLRERETLAALDHPGIATLMDGGIDSTGRPWFAMRYVDGLPIDAWCDAHRAGIEQRVDLLIQACEALAYAHARLVLHQDIKPANLMVNAGGQVQLLDFGLTASLAADALAPRIAISEGYAPPEATRGDRPTVASDLWSLGMVMYRLLCERLPSTASQWWLMGPATAPAPAPMSRMAADLPEAAAHVRGAGDAHALARRLAGDLDAIALRCIAFDPADRYASAVALRDDLLAWRHRRPVQARQGGALYRSARFVERHRLAVALASLAAVALAAGGALVAWQAERGAREAAATAALSQVFEQTLGVATLSGLGDTALSSRDLLQNTEQRVREVAGEDHPDVLARGLAILARNYTVLGDYRRATALAREAAALQGSDRLARVQQQATLAALLTLHGQPAEARRVAQAALDTLGPEDAGQTGLRLQLMTTLARSQWDQIERAQAQRTLDAALALAAASGDAVAQAELYRLRGYWRSRLIRFGEAEADLRRAIALASAPAPLVANDARQSLVTVMLLQERVGDAAQVASDLLYESSRRLGDHHPLVGRAWRIVANVECVRAELEACGASIARAEAIVRPHFGDHHPEYADVLRVRSLLSAYGQQPASEGLALLRRAHAIMRSTYPDDNENVHRIRSMLGARLLVISTTSPADERVRLRDEAIALLESALVRPSVNELPLQPAHRSALMRALMLRDAPGDRDRIRTLLDENARLMQAYPDGYSFRFDDAIREARLRLREGDAAGADAQLAALEPALQRYQGVTNNRFFLRSLWLVRAEIAAARGDRAGARRFIARALAHMTSAFGPNHKATVLLTRQLADFDRTGTVPSVP